MINLIFQASLKNTIKYLPYQACLIYPIIYPIFLKNWVKKFYPVIKKLSFNFLIYPEEDRFKIAENVQPEIQIKTRVYLDVDYTVLDPIIHHSNRYHYFK